MATHTYEVPAGDNVLPRFVGTKITLNEPDLVDGPNPFRDLIGEGKLFANAEAFRASALRDRRIMANRAVRKVLSDEKGTPAEANKAGNAVIVGAPRAPGQTKAKTPAARARSIATSTGNAMLDKCIADPNRAKAAIDAGLITREEIEAYRTAKTAPKTAPVEATPAAPSPTPAATTAKTGGKTK